MGLGELLDGAFQLLRADLGPMVLVTAVVVVPLGLATFFFTLDLQENVLAALTQNPDALAPTLRALTGRIPAWIGLAVAQSLLLLLATAAVTRIGGARYLGLRQGFVDGLRSAGRSAPALIGAQLAVTVLQAGALLLPALLTAAGLAVAGAGGPIVTILLGALGGLLVGVGALVAIWLWVVFGLVVPVVVLERAGPVEALARSQRLVRGRWWTVFLTLVLTRIVVALVAFALGGLPSALSQFFPQAALGQALAAIGSTLSSLVVTPATALVVLLLYFDARVRGEGLDLELRGGAGAPAG